MKILLVFLMMLMAIPLGVLPVHAGSAGNNLVVDFSWTPQDVFPGTTVRFTASFVGGVAPLTTYIWELGDGSPTLFGNSSFVHTYPLINHGLFTVTLTIQDSAGNTASVSHVLLHPGFTMSANPTFLFEYCNTLGCPYGEQSTSTVTLTSQSGFFGPVGISYIGPNPASGSSITGTSSVTVPSGGSVTFTVTATFPTKINTDFYWVIQAQNGVATVNIVIDTYFWVCHSNCPQ